MTAQDENASGGNAVAVQRLKMNDLSVKDFFGQENIKKAIASVLPIGCTAERMLKVALMAVNKQPALANCTRDSLLQAIMQSAELGLEPNTPLGLAYLIPYGREVTFQVGYKGMIRLAYQSGGLSSLFARVVYKNDPFAIHYGTDNKIEHRPLLEGDAGPMIGVYAVMTREGSAIPDFEYMTKAQVDAIRARSPAGRKGPWVSDYDEMAKKTAIRRLLKRAPLSPEKSELLAKALEADDAGFVELDMGAQTPVEDGDTGTEGVKAALKRKKERETAEKEKTPRPNPDVLHTDAEVADLVASGNIVIDNPSKATLSPATRAALESRLQKVYGTMAPESMPSAVDVTLGNVGIESWDAITETIARSAIDAIDAQLLSAKKAKK